MESLTYLQHGDYLIPNLTLQEQPDENRLPDGKIGKYGLMRREYLKAHRPILYNSLTLKASLHRHLLEIDKTATARLEQLMTELIEKHRPPDEATAQMAWVRHMNSLRRQAEEMLLTELIYS